MVGLWLVGEALAARATIKLDTDTLIVGQSVRVVVYVEDASPTAVPNLMVPDSLRVQYSGQHTRTGLQRDLAGKVHSMRTVGYQFDVLATAEGTFQIGPAAVEIGPTLMQTGTATLTVTAPPVAGESSLHAAAGFHTTETYEGAVVLYRYTLDYQEPVVRSQWMLPEFTGLVAPRDGYVDRDVSQITEPSPRTIDTTDMPLIATKAGTHEFSGAIAQVEISTGDRASPPIRFDPFGVFGTAFVRTRNQTVATGPASLVVNPLPPAPPGFTGLVGDFTVRLIEALPASVPVGRSARLQIAIGGDGSLEGFALAPISEVDGLRVYDGAPLAAAEVQDHTYRAEGRYERVIVPTREGTFAVPPLTLVTFSPTRGEYVTHTLDLGVVHAVPGEATDAAIASFAEARPPEVPLTPPDIRDARVGRAQRLGLGLAGPVALGLAGLPALGIALLELVARRRARLEAARKPAGPRPLERLARLPEDRSQRLAALDMALREALALRAGVAVAALDRDAASSDLPEVRAVTTELDRARFGGTPEEGLADRVVAIVRKLLS